MIGKYLGRQIILEGHIVPDSASVVLRVVGVALETGAGIWHKLCDMFNVNVGEAEHTELKER